MPTFEREGGPLQALSKHLTELKFTKPTAVQKQALPCLLSGQDLMMRAPTGTGKTLAYLAPIVDGLAAQSPRVSRGEGCHALVITPTRELTLQVCCYVILHKHQGSYVLFTLVQFTLDTAAGQVPCIACLFIDLGTLNGLS
jgi:superfamily II DNA or RNA helicase